MRFPAVVLLLSVVAASPHAARAARRNTIISLLEQHKSVFGVYAPSNGGRRGQPPASERPAIDLAKDAVAYAPADFLFNGSAENGIDRALPAIVDFSRAMKAVGETRPLVLKIPKIDPDRAKAADNISRELNAGASGIMFVETESAEEVRAGIDAMRLASHNNLWPLNPDGELINWTIVESLEGLKHVREIAQVKGIGVLWPGAGTLRNDVFTHTNANGERVFDAAGWENAIQQVLAACKEFHVPCGYPANVNDIEQRMQQGFSVFVMGWGDAGFKAVDIGRKTAGR
jgi:2-keto-3-deoxy-L-rhamnonate aldolase RhmA